MTSKLSWLGTSPRTRDGPEESDLEPKALVQRLLRGDVKVILPKPEEFARGCKEVSKEISDTELRKLHKKMAKLFPLSSLVGHCVRQPYGYASDFQVVDWIYGRYKCSQEWFGKIDEILQGTRIAESIRIRKSYFVSVVMELAERNGGNLDVLVLSLESGREILDASLLAAKKRVKVRFVCVEVDSNSISYAKAMTRVIRERVKFVQADIGELDKYADGKRFDLVWCAGRFDFLDDKRFVYNLRKAIKSTKKISGQVVIGSQVPNEECDMVRLFLRWNIFYRTPQELISLFESLKEGDCRAEVRSEISGLTQFLHVRRTGFASMTQDNSRASLAMSSRSKQVYPLSGSTSFMRTKAKPELPQRKGSSVSSQSTLTSTGASTALHSEATHVKEPKDSDEKVKKRRSRIKQFTLSAFDKRTDKFVKYRKPRRRDPTPEPLGRPSQSLTVQK